MTSSEVSGPWRIISELIDNNAQRIALACAIAITAMSGASAEARTIAPPQEHDEGAAQAQPAQLPSRKPVFIAGEGMTPPHLTELNRTISNFSLPIPRSSLITTVGKTHEYCTDAASEARPLNSMLMCINPEANEMHMQKVPLWQIARLAAHEVEGHEIPDAIVAKERKLRPGRPSELFVKFFMAAGMANNRAEAVRIMRSGPLDQKVPKDMREPGKYADEALAEVAGNCAQGGFHVAEGSTFGSWVSEDAKVELSAPNYTAACNYLYAEYSKHPDITVQTGIKILQPPPGPNYYWSKFCAARTENVSYTWPHPNYVWPQWRRACRDSD